MFWFNFVNQCEKIEKSPTVVVEDLGFKRSAVTSWKNGALPQVKNRKKIADYFGISVEELMGTKKEPSTMTSRYFTIFPGTASLSRRKAAAISA